MNGRTNFHCKGCGRFITFPDDHVVRGFDEYTCNPWKPVYEEDC